MVPHEAGRRQARYPGPRVRIQVLSAS